MYFDCVPHWELFNGHITFDGFIKLECACVTFVSLCCRYALYSSVLAQISIALYHGNILLILTTIQLCNADGLEEKMLPRLREPPAGLCQAASLTRQPNIVVAKVDYRNNIFTQPSLSNCMQLIIIEHNMQPNPSLFSLIKCGIHQSILPMCSMQRRLNGRRVLLCVHTAQQECSQWRTGQH